MLKLCPFRVDSTRVVGSGLRLNNRLLIVLIAVFIVVEATEAEFEGGEEGVGGIDVGERDIDGAVGAGALVLWVAQ